MAKERPLLEMKQEELILLASQKAEYDPEDSLRVAQAATELGKQREMIEKLKLEKTKLAVAGGLCALGLGSTVVFEVKGSQAYTEWWKALTRGCASVALKIFHF